MLKLGAHVPSAKMWILCLLPWGVPWWMGQEDLVVVSMSSSGECLRQISMNVSNEKETSIMALPLKFGAILYAKSRLPDTHPKLKTETETASNFAIQAGRFHFLRLTPHLLSTLLSPITCGSPCPLKPWGAKGTIYHGSPPLETEGRPRLRGHPGCRRSQSAVMLEGCYPPPNQTGTLALLV